MKRLAVIGALFAALLSAPSWATAQEFPTPTVETVTGNAAVSGSATDPTLTATGNGEASLSYGIDINICGGNLTCSYTFPSFGVATVPLLISYSLTASAGSGNGQAIAELDIYDVSETYGFADEYNCSFDGGRCGTSTYTAAPYDYEFAYCHSGGCDFQTTAYVYLHAYAGAGGSAEVDPTFAIDPSFLAQYPGATLTVTSVPLTPVPEPASWALAMLGLGLVGASLRARSGRARVATA